MIKYRAPEIEPPLPIVDQWLADVSAYAMPYVPLLMAAVVGLWCLTKVVLKLTDKRATPNTAGSSVENSNSLLDGYQSQSDFSCSRMNEAAGMQSTH